MAAQKRPAITQKGWITKVLAGIYFSTPIVHWYVNRNVKWG